MSKLIKRLVPSTARRSLKQTALSLDHILWRVRLDEDPVLRAPIFMIGCPRSGTSVAVRMFALHPDVANWSEAERIWDPYDYDNPGADHHWVATDVTDEDRKRLHSWFEWYRQKNKKERFINKHPRNSVRIEYIRAVFPDAYFVHVIRDGRAVVNSIIRKIAREPGRRHIPFGNFCKPPQWRSYLRDNEIEQAALQWREIVRYILQKKDELEDRYFEFRYEDMCDNTARVFADLYEFVGLPSKDSQMENIPNRLKNMNHKYENDLTIEELERINDIQAELLSEVGYMV